MARASSSSAKQGAGTVLAQSGASASHTGDTNEAILATIPIPAHLIGKNGEVVVECWFARNATGSGSVTPRVRFGPSGSGITGSNLSGSGSFVLTTANLSGRGLAQWFNTNSESAQTWFNTTTYTVYQAASVAYSTAAVDTTVATEINITAQLVNPGDTATLVFYRVTVYPKN